MIINIPLYKIGKKRHSLKFVDVDKERYNVLLVMEIQKGNKWEFGEIEVLGHAMKSDIRRLGKST